MKRLAGPSGKSVKERQNSGGAVTAAAACILHVRSRILQVGGGSGVERDFLLHILKGNMRTWTYIHINSCERYRSGKVGKGEIAFAGSGIRGCMGN